MRVVLLLWLFFGLIFMVLAEQVAEGVYHFLVVRP
jgi:hypothetical protein